MAATAWGTKIDELLADGEWHELDELLAASMELVPPGAAYRTGERHRRERRGNDRTVRTTQQGTIAAGRRRTVYDAIRSRVRHGTVERDGHRVRRLP